MRVPEVGSQAMKRTRRIMSLFYTKAEPYARTFALL
jgi:hypothetical protein